MSNYAIAEDAEAGRSEFLMILDDRETAEDIAHELRAGGRAVVVIEVERTYGKGHLAQSA